MHQVGEQGTHVLFAHLRVGRIRHGRVKVHTGRRDTFAHHAVELFEAVVTNPGLAVRGDVAGIDGAHGRAQFQAAGHLWALLGGVAGNAVTELGHVFALGDQFGIRFDGFVGVQGKRQTQRRPHQGQT